MRCNALEASNAKESDQALNASESEHHSCLICMDKVKNYTCYPYGHTCLCGEWAGRCIECPICEAHCQDVFKTYT